MYKNISKFKGYLKLPREFNKLLQDGELTLKEYGLLLIYIMNADWDDRHESYGTVHLSNKYLDKIEGLNRNSVAQIKKSLIKKSYIKKIAEVDKIDVIQIINFDKYQPKVNWNKKENFQKLWYEIHKSD